MIIKSFLYFVYLAKVLDSKYKELNLKDLTLQKIKDMDPLKNKDQNVSQNALKRKSEIGSNKGKKIKTEMFCEKKTQIYTVN